MQLKIADILFAKENKSSEALPIKTAQKIPNHVNIIYFMIKKKIIIKNS